MFLGGGGRKTSRGLKFFPSDMKKTDASVATLNECMSAILKSSFPKVVIGEGFVRMKVIMRSESVVIKTYIFLTSAWFLKQSSLA
jgi:hypothetical protein